MADPLGVACAAAQFVGLAGQAVEGIQYLRTQFQGIKTAPKLIKNIHRELKIFESTIAHLATLQAGEDLAQEFIATVEGCVDIFDGIYEQTSRYNLHREIYDEQKFKRLWRQVLANDNRPKFEEYLRRLERAKSSMLASMSALQLERTRYAPFGIVRGTSFSRLTI